MKKTKKTIILGTLTFVLFLFQVSPVFAQIKLVPAHPDPRDKETFTFVKINVLNKAQDYEDDFYLVNPDEKKYEVFLKPSQNQNIKLEFSEEELSVPPEKRILVNFTLTLPKNFPDGEYLFYINAYEKNSKQLVSRLPIKLLIGKKRNSKINVEDTQIKFSNEGIYINGRVKNTGNTIIDSLGFNLKLSNQTPIINLLGNDFEYYWTMPANLNPGQAAEFKKILPTSLPLGSYKATLQVIFSQDKPGVNKSLAATNLNFNLGNLLPLLKLPALLALFYFIFKKTRGMLQPFKFKLPSLALPFPKKSTRSNDKNPGSVEGLIKKVFEEERHLADAHNISYDRLLFEIRRIVREEIELWKEMENFKKRLHEKLEEEREEILKERLRRMTND